MPPAGVSYILQHTQLYLMSISGEHNGEVTAVHIASLIHKLKDKESLTAEEQQQLLHWRQADEVNERMYHTLHDREAMVKEIQQLQRYDTAAGWKELAGRLQLQQTAQVSKVYRMRRFLSAAAVLLLITGGAWLLLRPHTAVPPAGRSSAYHNDVAPGSSKATLTLADGSTIALDNAHSGQLAQQGKVSITQHNGQLAYQPAGKEAALLYNTMTTPRGGQFQLVLPDGSKVWMNAASAIRFPAAFNGKERLVELTGEAYFEIAPLAAKPFIVKVNDTRVTVLGTQFNVMAYTEEAASRTTLVEGLVKVEKGQQQLLVKPGQQALAGRELVLDEQADVEEALAWKNGRFQFGEQTSITSLMRQVANWYDVDVVYHGTVTNHIGGSVPRTATLAHLLKVLEATGVVHFTLQGRKVDVYPSD